MAFYRCYFGRKRIHIEGFMNRHVQNINKNGQGVVIQHVFHVKKLMNDVVYRKNTGGQKRCTKKRTHFHSKNTLPRNSSWIIWKTFVAKSASFGFLSGCHRRNKACNFSAIAALRGCSGTDAVFRDLYFSNISDAIFRDR